MSTITENKDTAVTSEVRERIYRQPEYQIRREENQYELIVNLPGVAREEVTLDVKADLLKLETRRAEPVHSGEKTLCRERYRGDYRLELKLGRDVDANSIHAQLQDGVLKIRLAKTAESVGRTVPVG